MQKRFVSHLALVVVAVATWLSLTDVKKDLPIVEPVTAPEILQTEVYEKKGLRLELPEQGVEVVRQEGDTAFVHIDMPEHKRLALEIEFSGPSREWSLNLGDSDTNNGWGGDSGTAMHDAELQVYNGSLDVYGSDLLDHDPDYGNKVRFMKRWENVAQVGGVLRIEVADGEVTYIDSEGRRDTLRHRGLFALAGQEDPDAGVNYDLYLGVNRVVNGGRSGSGVSRVKVSLF